MVPVARLPTVVLWYAPHRLDRPSIRYQVSRYRRSCLVVVLPTVRMSVSLLSGEVGMDRIIYAREDGGVSIVIPTDVWEGTLEELVKKVVPAGRPYKIVSHEDIPNDRTWRNAWVMDFEPDGVA